VKTPRFPIACLEKYLDPKNPEILSQLEKTRRELQSQLMAAQDEIGRCNREAGRQTPRSYKRPESGSYWAVDTGGCPVVGSGPANCGGMLESA